MRVHNASLRTRNAAAIALATVAMLALLLAGSQGAMAKKKSSAHGHRKGPAGLKFYKPPKRLPKGHGDLIWSRKAKGLVRLANARYTKLVLYTSKTPQGRRVAVSGDVSVPKGKPPKRGWPVISYAHGTTGVADVCAPTRNFVGGPAQSYISYIDPDLNEWLRAGYAVVRTDYQGLGTPGPHPYLVGQSEARSVLDIVSAAHDLDRRIGKRFLIAGHSQGGHAALFAAGAAKGWTPKLRLRGTVAFAPASHLYEQSQLLPLLTAPSPLTALATLILQGAATQSTAIDVNALLSDQALAFYPLLEQQCLSRLAASDELGGIAPSNLERAGADLSVLNPLLQQMNPVVSTTAPILIPQGDADLTVFPNFTNDLQNELKGAGDQVTYKTYPGIDHGGVVTAAEPDALAFFEQQLPPR